MSMSGLIEQHPILVGMPLTKQPFHTHEQFSPILWKCALAHYTL